MLKMLVLVLSVALFATLMMACSGTKYTVRAGFQHDSVSTDVLDANLAGWGAGGTIGIVARNGIEAVELCGNGRFYFGELEGRVEDGSARVVQHTNHTPIGVCAEMPVN